MSFRPATLAIVATLAHAASGCLTAGDPVVNRSYGGSHLPEPTLGSMRNVSVCDAVWTGSHPTPDDLELADRRGIATAIDLTSPDEWPGYDAAAVCEDLGIDYVRVEVSGDAPIPDGVVDRALVELRRHDHGSILLFSGSGDRAAMLLAIWRVVDGAVGVDQAIEEARRCGMKPGAPVQFVRIQIARLSA